MMQLEFGGKRFPIAAGETVIGTAPGCELVLAGEGIQPRHAILHGSPAGAAVRAAASEASVLVNGVALGGDPTPVLHGDKIQIGEHELVVVDPQRAGSTQLFDARAFEVLPRTARGGQVVGGATNGRLVCLTDGREYTVTEQLVFGRDAGVDVVVPGNDVSRHHAEIRLTADGYLLTDASVNGTYVNGVRVEQSRLLARSDIIRVGADEFRFYADAVAKAPPAPPAPAPAATSSPAAALLASFLVRSGALKGRRLQVRTPAANIGRADYNDIVIADSSVSTAHAKLRRRDGLWMLSDVGSTNGTYVDGERVTEETPIMAGATVRFGEVAALFEPHDDWVSVAPAAGTRVIERIEVPTPVGAAAAAAPEVEEEAALEAAVEAPAEADLVETPPRPPRPPRPTPSKWPIPIWLVAAVLAAAVGAAAAFLLLL